MNVSQGEERSRFAIYTSLVGSYESLLQPEVINEDFDYICFSSDIKEKRVGVWEIRKIPFSCSDATRLSRYVKLMPHKALPEYEYSLWMDANIQIVGKEFYDIILRHINDELIVGHVAHPFRDCIYDDIKECIVNNRVGYWEARHQYRHLKEEGFPSHYGLYENNIILRQHNDKKVITLSEDIWKEYSSYSKRDQFCLVYIYWKHKFNPSLLFDSTQSARNLPSLKYHLHPKDDVGLPLGMRITNAIQVRKNRLLLALFSL